MGANAVVVGGDKWVPLLKKLVKSQASLEVGVLEGRANKVTGKPIAPYAFFNEFGTADIPARPAFRDTLAENTDEWARGFGRLLKDYTKNPEILPSALEKLGIKMSDDIKAKIASNMPPPNAPGTIAAKNSDMGTLMETGSYHQAIDYRVKIR